MNPGTPVTLTLTRNKREFEIPGVVRRDHGPKHRFRYLVVCVGYDEFDLGIFPAPSAMFVYWAAADELMAREAEAA